MRILMGFCTLVSVWCGSSSNTVMWSARELQFSPVLYCTDSPAFLFQIPWSHIAFSTTVLLRYLQMLKQWKLHFTLAFSITAFHFHNALKQTLTIVSFSRSSVKLTCRLWIFPSLVIPLCESHAHLYLAPRGITPTHYTRGNESFFFKLCTVIHTSLSELVANLHVFFQGLLCLPCSLLESNAAINCAGFEQTTYSVSGQLATSIWRAVSVSGCVLSRCLSGSLLWGCLEPVGGAHWVVGGGGEVHLWGPTCCAYS